jgi:MoxR-like ATPase
MDLVAALRGVGYEPRRRELLAVAGALTAPPSAGARALLLEGPPGCGKSALAEAVAKATGAALLVYQCHSWTDANDLFVGVDVASAVAGDAERVRQDGILAATAKSSHHKTTVLLLDELDKAPERAENLLLDWLQTGRVPLAPGRMINTDLPSVLIFITSNGMRPLSDALLRRVRRVAMEPLPFDKEVELMHARTQLPTGVVTLSWKAAKAVSIHEGNKALSLQEGVRLLAELSLAANIGDVRESLAGWAARTAKGREYALKSDEAIPLWGELRRVKGV